MGFNKNAIAFQIGKNLKFLAKKKGLKQTEIAETLAVSKQAVSKVFRGQKLPSLEMLIRLSCIFEVPMDTIVNEELESSFDCNASLNEDDVQRMGYILMAIGNNKDFAIKALDKISERIKNLAVGGERQ